MYSKVSGNLCFEIYGKMRRQIHRPELRSWEGKTWVARGLGRCSTGDQSPVGFGAAVDGTTISFSSMMPAKDRMWSARGPGGRIFDGKFATKYSLASLRQ